MACNRRNSDFSLLSADSHDELLEPSSSQTRRMSLETCACFPARRKRHHKFGDAFRRLVHGGAESDKHPNEICFLGPSKTVSTITDFDKVPMDFSECRGRVITDPDEALEVEEEEALRLRHHLRNAPDSESRVHNTNLYMIEPWFHYDLSRDEADGMFKKYNYKTGTFLVRTSRRLGRFVLCLANGDALLHYPIMSFSVTISDQPFLTLDSGLTKFKDLVQLVEFYQVNTGGVLPVALSNYVTRAVTIPRYENKASSASSSL